VGRAPAPTTSRFKRFRALSREKPDATLENSSRRFGAFEGAKERIPNSGINQLTIPHFGTKLLGVVIWERSQEFQSEGVELARRGARPGEEPPKPKRNRLVSRKKLREFVTSHPGTENDATTFKRWCKIVEQAVWNSFSDIKATFGSADKVGEYVVFNVGGNKYRVIAFISFKTDGRTWVYIKEVLTHRDYDNWKKTN
jgi:mRNA interferase HigB